MSEYISQIIIGLIVTIIATWIGIGKGKTTIVHANGADVKKTGKRIMILSVIAIIGGIFLLGSNPDMSNKDVKFWISIALMGWGAFFFLLVN